MSVFQSPLNQTNQEKLYQWAIIGAGPAGIAAVGKLIDQGIEPNEILWVDADFKVGDFGQKWKNVLSNTRIEKFLSYLYDAKSFGFAAVANEFEISRLDPQQTCYLKLVAQPLQWITSKLRDKIDSEKAMIDAIQLKDRTWHLSTTAGAVFKTKNLILAIGAEPRHLDYPTVDAIPFEIAIDKDKLAKAVDQNNTIAVFGSSHSAIIILRYLTELKCKKIINFYQSPCRYAIEMGDWILFDDTGLKGSTADWARDNIDGILPNNLRRCYSNAQNVSQYLPQCDKVIYAVGLKKRHLTIRDYGDLPHNRHNGIIAPGLFGLGIAYPQAYADPLGTVEERVGLFKFMDYLKQVLPVWIKYHP